jgi:hypothetical protein
MRGEDPAPIGGKGQDRQTQPTPGQPLRSALDRDDLVGVAELPQRRRRVLTESTAKVRAPASSDAATILAVQLPEIIPIKHEPDYRTDRIGRYAGGQFFADVTGAYQEGVVVGTDWARQQRIYALLHRFDNDGRHRGSDVWLAGIRSDGPAAVESAEEMLSGWLSEIGPVTFCDIAIRPFRVVFDHVVFGLIDETSEDPLYTHGGPWAELYPEGLGFHEPWDGEYDT